MEEQLCISGRILDMQGCFVSYEITVQNRTAHLLRCPYENVKIKRAGPIAAGNFHGLAGVSVRGLNRYGW